ncbi:MAG: hypothetical protein ACKVJK_14380 [Methylophagaceae bacterium]|jgi:hypothetical protein|tara:strand:+ start:604 stop:975 length:372 start_codon:yes stop_codon:yes gene_type:complete
MLLKNIEKDFPFISVVTYGGNEYVGIIANQDQYVTSMYVFTLLKTDTDKKRFLELGDSWWWESNRMIPISIFLRTDISPYSYALMTMNSKDVRVTIGPCVNLNALSVKRVKRKSVQLMRKKPK